MSSYKFAQFIFSFIKSHRPGLSSLSTTTTQIHNNMMTSSDTLDHTSMDTSANTEEKTLQAVIRPQTAQLWLNKLEYKYTDIKKSVFFDGHERSDVVEDRHQFLSELEKLSPYLVEFCDNGTMIPKKYLFDCAVNGLNCQPCILITHDESTFSANDG